MGIRETLRDMDAYPKPHEDFRIKTFIGGSVTIISTAIIVLLFISEFLDYVTPKIIEELFVDTSRSPKLKINIDIELPHVACSYLSLDAMDSSGDHQIGIEHNIFKQRIDNLGNPISPAEKTINLGDSSIGKSKNKSDLHEDLNEKKNVNGQNKTNDEKSVDKPKCGSCYGAENAHTKCCNTCDDVKEAYRLKGWAMQNPDTIDQCKGMVEEMKKVFNEGCRIYGHMEVTRVTGSFHVAPGKSFSISHVHVHDVQPYSSSQFNMTHKVRSLTFGDPIPDKPELTNPMDGISGISPEESTMFQYYFKIVPTMYEKLDGSILYTNQFSITRHQKAVSLMSGESGMPGVFFSYEISPIMIKFSEKRKSLGHFLTGVFAIIGGIFTVAGIIDALIYKSEKLIKQKLEIGKQG